MTYEIIPLASRPGLLPAAAQWFHEKWAVPLEAYRESMARSLAQTSPVPSWYLALEGGQIIGGLGVIENDFHPRTDLTPNVCAVYTEPARRRQGVAGALLQYACGDMCARGVATLYLLTDHTAFYERYGWEYLCPVLGDGEEEPSRMYIHRA